MDVVFAFIACSLLVPAAAVAATGGVAAVVAMAVVSTAAVSFEATKVACVCVVAC